VVKKTEITTIRFFCLMGAVTVYALLGSPTPNNPGLVEIIIGALLVLAAGVPGLFNAFKPLPPDHLWMAAGRALLVYGLTASLIVSVLAGRGAVPMIRDLVPFLFMLLPLFLHDIFIRRPDYVALYIKALVFTGLVFAARGLPEIIGWWVPETYQGELHYFANAPTVLFAALFLAGYGAQQFVMQFTSKSAIKCAAYITLSLLPFAAILLTLQRASIAAFVAGILFLALAGFYRHPPRAVLLFLIVGVMGFVFFAPLAGFTDLVAQKSAAVGLNMRAEEFNTAWRTIGENPGTLFFGTGWGGTFESPAVAGLEVNYTHSLLSAMLLKTGLFGFALGCLYLIGFLPLLYKSLRRNMALTLAVAAPITIDVFLYASYKSLDFGLLLLLAAAAAPALKVASGRRVLYSETYISRVE
jgi:hypothetical protein